MWMDGHCYVTFARWQTCEVAVFHWEGWEGKAGQPDATIQLSHLAPRLLYQYLENGLAVCVKPTYSTVEITLPNCMHLQGCGIQFL